MTNRNSFVEAKGRERTEKENGGAWELKCFFYGIAILSLKKNIIRNPKAFGAQ
jgi:hypothetical protein